MEKNIENALDIMLAALGRTYAKKRILDKVAKGYTIIAPKQLTKTRFKFWFIGRELGLYTITDVFIVELDTNKYDNLMDYVKKTHKRYDMFEFERYDNCIVAYD